MPMPSQGPLHNTHSTSQLTRDEESQGPSSDRYWDLVQMISLVHLSVHKAHIIVQCAHIEFCLGSWQIVSPEPGGALSPGIKFREMRRNGALLATKIDPVEAAQELRCQIVIFYLVVFHDRIQ